MNKKLNMDNFSLFNMTLTKKILQHNAVTKFLWNHELFRDLKKNLWHIFSTFWSDFCKRNIKFEIFFFLFCHCGWLRKKKKEFSSLAALERLFTFAHFSSFVKTFFL